jgi:hypothetical protein
VPAGTAPQTRTPAPSRPIRGAADALATLRRLDAARADAFAARDPAPLHRVYASTALFRRDRALPFMLLPPDCRLAGVRTDYRSVRLLSSGPESAAVAARATLRPSRLLCDGHPAASAAGSGATEEEIRLSRGPGGYRISLIRPLTPF